MAALWTVLGATVPPVCGLIVTVLYLWREQRRDARIAAAQADAQIKALVKELTENTATLDKVVQLLDRVLGGTGRIESLERSIDRLNGRFDVLQAILSGRARD